MKGFVNPRAMVYSVVLGISAATVMTGVGEFTAPYKESNAKADRMRKILVVLEIPIPEKASAKDLVEIYDKNVRVEEKAGLTRYIYAPGGAGGEVKAVAIPVDGPGLWGPINGFLALAPDMKTIRGLSFYHQEETPGLGSEIESKLFLTQFSGKSIVDESGGYVVNIVKPGMARAANEFDGISGATMTCGKLTKILNGSIGKLSEGTK